MAYYYRYNFISPEPIYSIVKEELKSYFDTGAVDDLMFPTYLDKCLQKMGRSSYVIAEQTLDISGYEARLPDNFLLLEKLGCVQRFLSFHIRQLTHSILRQLAKQLFKSLLLLVVEYHVQIHNVQQDALRVCLISSKLCIKPINR